MSQETAPLYYTNNVSISMNTFDFAISIGSMGDKGPELLAQIMMSPQHFKAFTNLVNQNLHNYELVYGIINLDPNKTVIDQIVAGGAVVKEYSADDAKLK